MSTSSIYIYGVLDLLFLMCMMFKNTFGFYSISTHKGGEREREARLEEDTHSLSVYSQCSNTVDSVGEEFIYN